MNESATTTTGSTISGPAASGGLWTEVLDAVRSGVALVDDRGLIHRANPAFCRLAGLEPEAVVGNSLPAIFAGADPEPARWTELTAGRQAEWSFQFRNHRGQLEHLTASVRPDPTAASSAPRHFLLLEDDSPRVQLQQAIEQRDHGFEQLAAHTPGMIYKFVISRDGRASFPYASPGCQDLWEIDPRDVREDATAIVRLIHPDDLSAFQESVMKSAATLTPWDFKGRMITPSGRLKWWHAASRPERADNGDVVWQGQLMDITDQKQIEAELKLAKARADEARKIADEANQSKSQFLANMSHELRTPLNAILGYSEMLQEESDDAGVPEFKADLQRIHSAGKHLLGLINDVLDLSKIEAGKMTLYLETFEIARMVEEVASTVRPLIEKNQNLLVVNCPPEAGAMRADLTKVRQTLFNLLSNASKFTEHGQITLEVERLKPTEAQGVRLSFRVTDTGIGMTPAQLGKLFQAFTQADGSTSKKYGGTGLGLTISRRFCQMMGGDIAVSSESGRGSIFTVTLPAEIQDPAAEVVPAGTAVAPAGVAAGARVLVIDDDAAVRDLLFRSLTKEGYRVDTAPDGVRGLELARQLLPAVITLDVMMPSLDGWAVLSQLKADPATADIPVVMMTMVDDRSLGYALGAADYLTKPIEWSRLGGLLRRHVQAGGSRQVLVVEDDPDTRDLFQRNLSREGWQVDTAENGRVGLERVTARTPGLILLDLMMPVMDGFEFLSELRRRPGCERIPVIVVTAKVLGAEERQQLQGQFTRVLEKSRTSPDQLVSDLRSLLQSL